MFKQYLEEHYRTIIIVLLLLVVFCIYRIKKLYPKSIDVEPKLIKSIVAEGEYSFVSNMTITDIHKNGGIAKGKLTVTHEDTTVRANIVFTAYDTKTKEKLYDGVRKTIFNYTPDQGNNLFRTSTTYRNNKIVSHIHGFAIAKTNDSITFHSSGSWQTSSNDYKHIESIHTKTNNGLKSEWYHYNILGFVDFELNEKMTFTK